MSDWDNTHSVVSEKPIMASDFVSYKRENCAWLLSTCGIGLLCLAAAAVVFAVSESARQPATGEFWGAVGTVIVGSLFYIAGIIFCCLKGEDACDVCECDCCDT